ncbi:hypothetical protein TSOC_004612 [Tetrabaena socialis]|uniref:Uncharacterized protein n=1 Tax=Tetrabaena socialis TaxID=47790 RepID=A0A2J8A8E1_9CHLO|nr:hypothetical protein TSOC_004612 [Tetrabaena socialis]|eukprot:PNH08802.1 hypothetical protein TSOC_004612 [Tetrabaena socialis]
MAVMFSPSRLEPRDSSSAATARQSAAARTASLLACRASSASPLMASRGPAGGGGRRRFGGPEGTLRGCGTPPAAPARPIAARHRGRNPCGKTDVDATSGVSSGVMPGMYCQGSGHYPAISQQGANGGQMTWPGCSRLPSNHEALFACVARIRTHWNMSVLAVLLSPSVASLASQSLSSLFLRFCSSDAISSALMRTSASAGTLPLSTRSRSSCSDSSMAAASSCSCLTHCFHASTAVFAAWLTA